LYAEPLEQAVPTRRELVAGLGAGGATALAGCGRAIRANSVPGGLKFVNERVTTERVVVRAVQEGGEVDEDATPTPLGDTTTVEGQFTIPAESTRYAKGFFDNPGVYAVEVRNGGEVATTYIELYRTLGGGLGTDTVVVTLSFGGSIEVRATGVD
jgi:hypothetical protein